MMSYVIGQGELATAIEKHVSLDAAIAWDRDVDSRSFLEGLVELWIDDGQRWVLMSGEPFIKVIACVTGRTAYISAYESRIMLRADADDPLGAYWVDAQLLSYARRPDPDEMALRVEARTLQNAERHLSANQALPSVLVLVSRARTRLLED